MNAVDVLFATVLLGAAVFGFWKGFVLAVGTLVASAAGAWVASRFTDTLAPSLEGMASGPAAARGTATVLLFLVTFAGSYVAAWFVHRGLRRLELGWLDRTLGLLLGAFAGFLVVATLVVAAIRFVPERPETTSLRASRLASAVIEITRLAEPAMPPGLAEEIEKADAWLRGGVESGLD
jgi:uncharacterized membrane protein required for colicin V production